MLFALGMGALVTGGAVGFLGGTLIVAVLLWLAHRYIGPPATRKQQLWYLGAAFAGLPLNFVVMAQ